MVSSHDNAGDSNGLNYPLLYEDLAGGVATESVSNKPRVKVGAGCAAWTWTSWSEFWAASVCSGVKCCSSTRAGTVNARRNSSHRKAPAHSSHRSPRQPHAPYEFPRAEARADLSARPARAARNPQLCIWWTRELHHKLPLQRCFIERLLLLHRVHCARASHSEPLDCFGTRSLCTAHWGRCEPFESRVWRRARLSMRASSAETW